MRSGSAPSGAVGDFLLHLRPHPIICPLGQHKELHISSEILQIKPETHRLQTTIQVGEWALCVCKDAGESQCKRYSSEPNGLFAKFELADLHPRESTLP